MEKPIQPWPPNKFSFQWSQENGSTEEHVIYWHRELINEDYDSESYAEECEEYEYTAPTISINNLTLADLIHLVPTGIDHSQVKLSVDWPRMMDWIDYKYVYHVPVNKAAKKAEYDAAMKEFKIAEAKYNSDMIEYEKYMNGIEIAALEEKLAKLKK